MTRRETDAQPVAGEEAVLSEALAEAVGEVVRNMPQWLRNELSSSDVTIRDRAEDTLIAMIAVAAK